MEYQVVFDSLQESAWWPSAVGALIILCGLAGLRKAMSQPGKQSGLAAYSCVALVVLAGIFTIANSVKNATEKNRLEQIRKTGPIRVVEGQVQHLTTSADGESESFYIYAIPFAYSEHSNTPGFHQTTAYDGPLRNGLDVRVQFYYALPLDGKNTIILKLEVKK